MPEFLKETHIIYIAVLLIMLAVILRVIDVAFSAFSKRTKRVPSIHTKFLKDGLKAFFIIFVILEIGSQFQVIQKFYSSILMSSSLIIVVLGFVMQEGISNIVHGMIISVCKPFDIGDRIKITIDGQEITGYVESITLRNTVIKNVITSARVIVPNAKMDLGVIENSYFVEKKESSNYVDVCITYESDIELACQIISEEISSHPLYSKKDPDKTPQEMVPVLARELNERGVVLRAFVSTKTIEENFAACSDIRKSVAKRIQTTPGVAFAYTRIQVKD